MTKEEFKTLVMPSRDKLYRLALSLLSDRQEAEDTLQDAFLKLWRMREKLAAFRSVEALAVTMTKNLCLDKLRSYKSRKQDGREFEPVKLPSEFRDPAAGVELSESSAIIHSLIETLPEQQRLVMHLRDVELYSYDEIEELTGLERNNIRVNLSRARKNVRQQYLKRQNYEHRKN